MQERCFQSSNVAYLLAAVCILLSWLVPNHYFPWSSFYNDFLAAVSLWFLFIGLNFRNKTIEVPIHLFLLLLVALIPIFQFMFGVIAFLGDAFIAVAYIVGFAVSVLVGKQLSFNEEGSFFSAIAACFAIGAIISSVLALHQWLGLSLWGGWVVEIRPGGRPFANLGQPNNFALLECLGLISILYLWESKVLGRGVSILIAIVLMIGIVLSQSRTPWVIAGVFIVWWMWKRNSIGIRLHVGAVVAGLALYIFLLFVLPVFYDWYEISLTEGLSERTLGVDSARKIIWLQLWDAVIQGPVWGYGWNQVSLAQVFVSTNFPTTVYTEHSHNLFLDLLLWNGPVLGIILIFCITWWGLKNAFSCQSMQGWYGLACIAFMLSHGMLEYPLEYAYFLFPLGVLIGGVVSFGLKVESKVISVSRGIMYSSVVLGAAILWAIFSEYLIIEKDARLMRFETARIGSLKAEKKAPNVFILTQLREYNRFARTEAQSNMEAEELEWMGRVAHRYAYPAPLFRYSLALFLNNQPEEGRLELARLRQLHGENNFKEAKQNLKLLADKYPQLKNLGL